MKLLLLVLIVVALVLAIDGAWQIVSPPYSGAQIAGSLVDTWQASAFVTTLVLALLCIFACLAIAIRVLAGQRLRKLSYVALLIICAAVGAQLAGHIVLSRQVARVTGQTFGSLYGLL